MEKFNQIQESFGSKLAECRRGKNFTQEELANRLGVTPQALSKWEKGLSSPDISMICSICGVLDISADYLLGTDAGKITEDGNAKTCHGRNHAPDCADYGRANYRSKRILYFGL